MTWTIMHDDVTIQINMLGCFAVFSGGSPVTLGRNTGAKFLSFLQMLILAGEQGVSRQEVEDALFAGDDLSDVANSVNNLIYQSRKQLARSGLGEYARIRKTKLRYFLESESQVETDTGQFLRAAAVPASLPEDAADDIERAWRAAVDCYTGDLLPATKDNAWIDEQRKALREIYRTAVDTLAGIYRARGNSKALIDLYTHAAGITEDTDAGLQTALILSLIDSGDTHTALHIYDRTLRTWQQSSGGRIPDRLEECARRLSAASGGESVSLKDKLFDIVRVDAGESTEDQDGAFYCNYPSFIDALKLHRRTLGRNPHPVTLMFLTLVDYEGKPLTMKKKQEYYSLEFKEAIRSALRTGDSFTRHDETGFLVLLPGADEENAVSIYDRISRRFKEKAGSNVAVRYRMISLSDPQLL